MSTICHFEGIKILMYSNDHNPPHFHVICQGAKASFYLDGRLYRGSLPPKKMKLVRAWAASSGSVLAACWDRARGGSPLGSGVPPR